MSCQFFHHREENRISDEILPKGGATFSVEELSIHAFDHLSKALGITVKLRVGIARCSLKDNYNKRIGRKISEARMCSLFSGLRTFLVEEITDFGNTDRELTLVEENGKIVLVFKNNKDSKKVRLVNAYEN
jgi:hypothetical protein